jgi:hypothetical protein
MIRRSKSLDLYNKPPFPPFGYPYVKVEDERVANLCAAAIYQTEFPLSSTGDPTAKLTKIANEHNELLWMAGILPLRIKARRTRWVVGFQIHGSFHGSSAIPITVGPAIPTHFNPRLFKHTYHDPRARA